MCVRRLLVLSLLILTCVATVAAQSSDKRTDSPSAAPTQTAQASTESKNDAIRPLDSHTPHIQTLEQNEATCYTLRTYRVTREDSKSDTTRPAGYSTCQRATRFQLRTTVETVEIAPR